MKLQVTGPKKTGEMFSQIWGWYVTGFKHEEHCQACFKGTRELQIDRNITEQPIDLRHDAGFFYLCALGKPRSAESNVQLAVKPALGAVASVGSLYGFTFTISDAVAIRIKTLPLGWNKLGKEFTQCPNFQFAVQTYGYPQSDGVLDFGSQLLIPKPNDGMES